MVNYKILFYSVMIFICIFLFIESLVNFVVWEAPMLWGFLTLDMTKYMLEEIIKWKE